ncbi:hypothetical protein Ahy_B10g104713 [Arachis hypogaea]|uniref:Histone acetyltransferase n=1 Tax=Arachis hypogaea TaxID=3818 RepID=A0A444X696_ARAHY|nr:hypothetical protein Ahy_B10g104713 [Arachis hypogaea]
MPQTMPQPASAAVAQLAYAATVNRSAKNLYGYAKEEALGQDGIKLIVDPIDFALADDIVNRVVMGESWTGQNKMGEQFLAVATNTPFYDDDGSLVGIICDLDITCLDVRIIKQVSKVSNKIKSRIRTGKNNGDRESGSRGSHQSEHFSFSEVGVADHREDANSSGASTPRAYELSKKKGKVGTPERPLSDLGLLSYRGYWTRVLLDILKKCNGNISIKKVVFLQELSDMTAIKTEDILTTLQSLELIQYKKGQHLICADSKVLDRHLKVASRGGLEVNVSKLIWTPCKEQN